jgi:cysteine-rich repeat protein
MQSSTAVALAILLLVAARADADGLTGGSRARWRTDPLRGTTAAVLFRHDPALATPANPTCGATPTGATLSFDTGATAPSTLTLPCDGWYGTGGRYRYLAPDRTVKVSYGGGRLDVKISRLPPPALVTGPLARADVRFTVGAASACGRFTTFVRNDPTLVAGRGPSVACPAVCGDGFRDGDEECDDGNAVAGDGCRPDCTAERCGDGIVDPGEACDGDACCSSGCALTCAHDVDGDGRVTVLCFGDSNTLQFWPRAPSWCTTIPSLVGPEFTFVNASVFGLSAGGAAPLLADALDTVAPDAVVIALGTNDLPYAAPTDVALTLLQLDGQARTHCYPTGRCAQSWVASIPPRYAPAVPYETERTAVNALLASVLPAPTRLVDFASGMPPEFFQADGLHFDADGQAERALRARFALTRQ